MNPAKPPFTAGNLNAARQGFWDQRTTKENTGDKRYTAHSPLWSAYNWGYAVAAKFADGYWPWVYTKDKLQERAVQVALATTANIESRREKLGEARVNEVLALRAGWQVLVEDMQRRQLKKEVKNRKLRERRKKNRDREQDDTGRRA